MPSDESCECRGGGDQAGLYGGEREGGRLLPRRVLRGGRGPADRGDAPAQFPQLRAQLVLWLGRLAAPDDLGRRIIVRTAFRFSSYCNLNVSEKNTL